MRDEPPYQAPDVQLPAGFGLHKNYTPTMWERHRQSRRADEIIEKLRDAGEIGPERRAKEAWKVINKPVEPPAPWWVITQRKR